MNIPIGVWYALNNSGGSSRVPYKDAVLAMGPLSYWRLGEATPGTGTAVDEMGAHNGTYVGSPTSAAGLLTNDANTAVTFDGATQFINFGQTHFLSGLANSSIVVWFSSGPISSHDRVLYSERRNNDIFDLGVALTNGRPKFTYRDSAGTLDQIIATSGTYANNGRHCFIMTKAGTAVILYADGTSVKAATLTASDTFTDATRVTEIFADYSDATAFYPGVGDEVGIFTRALTPTEVAALVAAGTT